MARWLLIQLDAGKLPDSGGAVQRSRARADVEAADAAADRPRPASLTADPADVQHLRARLGRAATIAARRSSGTAARCSDSQTAVVLIPDKHVGFSIEINSEDGEIILGLMYELLDHYLGVAARRLAGEDHRAKEAKIAEGLKEYQAAARKPAKVGPSLPLARYVGTYADPWYGNIEIGRQTAS